MIIGSKAQLQYPSLDQFSINLDSNKIEHEALREHKPPRS